MEYFKDVPGYEGFYAVSNRGRILSFIKQKMLKPHLHKFGYHTVCLKHPDRERKYLKIHRLVLAAFRGESPLMVNHLNHIRNDNNLSNLEYVTAHGNVLHCKAAGRNSPPPKKKRLIPHETIRKIRKSKLRVRELMVIYKLSQTQIYEIKARNRYADVTDE